jgi:hypothetical protein
MLGEDGFTMEHSITYDECGTDDACFNIVSHCDYNGNGALEWCELISCAEEEG